MNTRLTLLMAYLCFGGCAIWGLWLLFNDFYKLYKKLSTPKGCQHKDILPVKNTFYQIKVPIPDEWTKEGKYVQHSGFWATQFIYGQCQECKLYAKYQVDYPIGKLEWLFCVPMEDLKLADAYRKEREERHSPLVLTPNWEALGTSEHIHV